MAPKCKSDASDGDASKKRKTITIESNAEIIKRSARGETPKHWKSVRLQSVNDRDNYEGQGESNGACKRLCPDESDNYH